MDTTKHAAVLGGRGMLGTDLVAVLAGRGAAAEAYDLPGFDVRNPRHVQQALRRAGAVINCAAYTDVDGAESDPGTAYGVNAQAVGELGRLAASAGVPVLHVSTDYVFDGGGDRPWREDDPAAPLGVYGASKLEGERQLASSGCRFCIVRLQWTYGAAGNNFIRKILERASAGRPLRVVDDQVGSPTSTREAARALADLLLGPGGLPGGVFHFAAAGFASRFEVARFVVGEKGLGAEVLPCSSREFPAPARRPGNSRFDCRKISRLLGEPIRPWQEPLRRYLENVQA